MLSEINLPIIQYFLLLSRLAPLSYFPTILTMRYTAMFSLISFSMVFTSFTSVSVFIHLHPSFICSVPFHSYYIITTAHIHSLVTVSLSHLCVQCPFGQFLTHIFHFPTTPSTLIQTPYLRSFLSFSHTVLSVFCFSFHMPFCRLPHSLQLFPCFYILQQSLSHPLVHLHSRMYTLSLPNTSQVSSRSIFM